MDGGKEGGRILRVAGGDAAPALEVQKRVFDQMAQLVEVFVVSPPNGAVLLGRDHGLHALLFGLFEDGVAVIAPVRDQIIRIEPFDQAASLRAIRTGTSRDKNSERQTMRIHGQMYLGVEPPFVRLIS